MTSLVFSQQSETADMGLAKRMAEALNRHYPGHLWAVTADSFTGIATVKDLFLSGNWGVVLKLADVYHDPDLKSVMRAGGELLERYKLRRGRFDSAQYSDLSTDFAGRFKPEL